MVSPDPTVIVDPELSLALVKIGAIDKHWAIVMSNSPRALKRIIASRSRDVSGLDIEYQNLLHMVTAAVNKQKNLVSQFRNNLIEVGYSLERLINFSTLVSTVYRNLIFSNGLGFDSKFGATTSSVSLSDRDEALSPHFEIIPNWARAASHDESFLELVKEERRDDLSFSPEIWTMVGLALAITISSRLCVLSFSHRLKEQFGWSDCKIASVTTLVASAHSENLLAQMLEIEFN